MKGHAVNDDDLRLAQLGHAQSFERQFSRWTMLGLSFAILNSWTALAASLSLALPSGGPIAVRALVTIMHPSNDMRRSFLVLTMLTVNT